MTIELIITWLSTFFPITVSSRPTNLAQFMTLTLMQFELIGGSQLAWVSGGSMTQRFFQSELERYGYY